MRPIDADNLLKGIEELKESPWFKRGKLEDTDTDVDFNRGLQHCGYLERKEAIEIIIDLCIKKEPTVEVEPVKHGRWIDFPECLEYDGALDEEYIVCSECHHVWNTIDNCAETFRYCPNCGSKNKDGDSE